MSDVDRKRGADIFRQHPILSEFAESVFSESLSLADEIESLDPKRFIRKHRSIRISFDKFVKLQIDSWADHINGIRYGANGGLIDLDEDELEHSEFDVLVGIAYCALDEIGVLLKDHLSSKSSKRRSDFRQIEELASRIYKTYDKLVLIHEVFSGEKPIRAFYDALSVALTQADAPFLFRVDHGVLDAPSPKSGEEFERIDRDALSALGDQARILIDSIESSNVDPRLAQLARKYLVSIESGLSVITLELYANQIRALLSSLEKEISSSILVSGTALMLSHEQVMRHSDRWRKFVEHPLIPVSDPSRLEKNTIAIFEVLGVAAFRTSVTERTRAAAADLQEASRIEDVQGRIRDAVLKSVANLIKANVKYAIGLIKKGYIELNGLPQRIYLSLFLRLLPHFKLICSYINELAWLVPILDYIQALNAKDSSKETNKVERK